MKKSIDEELEQQPITAVAYTGQNKKSLGLSGYCNPIQIDKDWGYELIYQNNSLYCCKKLYIYSNCSCSYHLHMEKHETLLVVSGTLYIDTTYNKTYKTHIVKEGQAFVIAPGFVHSLRAKENDVILIESSTPSYDTDSIRILNGE